MSLARGLLGSTPRRAPRISAGPPRARQKQVLCTPVIGITEREFALSCYAAPTAPSTPATYRAVRPHRRQRSVTCARGGGGLKSGWRSISPEQEGQLSEDPVRSLAIRFRACAGLNVAGRGLRISASSEMQLQCG